MSVELVELVIAGALVLGLLGILVRNHQRRIQARDKSRRSRRAKRELRLGHTEAAFWLFVESGDHASAARTAEALGRLDLAAQQWESIEPERALELYTRIGQHASAARILAGRQEFWRAAERLARDPAASPTELARLWENAFLDSIPSRGERMTATELAAVRAQARQAAQAFERDGDLARATHYYELGDDLAAAQILREQLPSETMAELDVTRNRVLSRLADVIGGEVQAGAGPPPVFESELSVAKAPIARTLPDSALAIDSAASELELASEPEPEPEPEPVGEPERILDAVAISALSLPEQAERPLAFAAPDLDPTAEMQPLAEIPIEDHAKTVRIELPPGLLDDAPRDAASLIAGQRQTLPLRVPTDAPERAQPKAPKQSQRTSEEATATAPELHQLATRYELLEPTGGPLGTGVYGAYDGERRGLVALEIEVTEWRFDEQRLGAFQRGAQRLLTLRHPNLVRVSDGGVFDGYPCLVTELIEGETLAARVSADDLDRLPILEVLDVADGLLSALEYLHRKGVVHGAVTPNHIVCDARGTARLFGLGASIAARVSGGQPRFERDYTAPEQRSGGAPTTRSDLFAASAVIYRLLTGHVPFREKEPVSRPPSTRLYSRAVPWELDVNLLRSLDPEPSQRAVAVDPVLRALRSMQQDVHEHLVHGGLSRSTAHRVIDDARARQALPAEVRRQLSTYLRAGEP